MANKLLRLGTGLNQTAFRSHFHPSGVCGHIEQTLDDLRPNGSPPTSGAAASASEARDPDKSTKGAIVELLPKIASTVESQGSAYIIIGELGHPVLVEVKG